MEIPFDTNPKRHHFLPQFYLRAFARNDYLCLYDRKKSEYRCQKPLNTAVIGQFYTTELEGGESDTLVEQVLGKTESHAKPVINALIRGERLTHAQRADLSWFLAFLFTRTPKFERETLQVADQMHKQIAKEQIPNLETAERILAKSGNTTLATGQSFYDFVHKEQFRIAGHRNITLDLMVSQARQLAKELGVLDWEVVHAPPKRTYITSDSPFGYIIPEHLRETDRPILGILSEEIVKVIALAPSIVLRIGSWGAGFSHVEASRQELAEINIAVAKECERFVIGSSEDQVRFVVERSQIDTLKTGTQLKLESVTHPTDPKRSFLVTHRVSVEKANCPFNPKNLLGVR